MGISAVCLFFLPVFPIDRAMFLHNDLLCNGRCSITGVYYADGGTKGKDLKNLEMKF